MQISKAKHLKLGLFPSTKFERHFISVVRVFSVNCMMPAPTFWIKAARSLIDSSATTLFLSHENSDATKLLEMTYWWSWLHIRNCMKMMSILPELQSSYNQCQWMLFWSGLEGKHTRPFRHWFAVRHQRLLWWTLKCFWPAEFFLCREGPKWLGCSVRWCPGCIRGDTYWFCAVLWCSWNWRSNCVP